MGEDALFHRLYSVGHSNIPIDKFISLLNQHSIEVVVDVRSHPFSKYATHFNYDAIQAPLKASGIKYLYLGKELGGMPKNPEFYDARWTCCISGAVVKCKPKPIFPCQKQAKKAFNS